MKKPEQNPYRHSDKALKRLYRLAEALFQRMAVSTAKWDELNVIGQVRSVYDDVERQAEDAYQKIAQSAYKDAQKALLLIFPEGKQWFHSLPGMIFVAALLDEYDGKTQYVYRRELERKRDRLVESLMAVNHGSPEIFNSQATRESLRRGLGLFEGQMRNMADTVTDAARVRAFDDAGVKTVRWVTQEDEKVCKVCRERNGVKFPLYGVPAKHPNCRCYLVPVAPGEDESV